MVGIAACLSSLRTSLHYNYQTPREVPAKKHASARKKCNKNLPINAVIETFLQCDALSVNCLIIESGFPKL